MSAIFQLCIFVSYIVFVKLMDDYHTKMIKKKLREEEGLNEINSGNGNCPE